MHRTTTSVKISEEEVRHKTKIEDDESYPEEPNFRARQMNFMSTLSQHPELLLCGFDPFQKLSIYHNGQRWVAEAEAVSKIK